MSDLTTQLQSYGDQLEASVAPVEFDPSEKPDGTSRLAIVFALAASVLIVVYLASSALRGGDEGLEVVTDEDGSIVEDTPETTVPGEPEPDSVSTSEPAPTSTEPTLPNAVPTFSSFGLSIDESGDLSIVNWIIDPGGEQIDSVLTVFEDGVEAATQQLEQPVNQFALATFNFNVPLEPAEGPRREVGLRLEADDGTANVTLAQDWVMVDGTPFVVVMDDHGKTGDNILPRFADLTIVTEGNVLSIVAEVVDPDDQQLTATVALIENGEQIALDEQPSAPGPEDSERFAFELTMPDRAAEREMVLELIASSDNGTVNFKLTWTMSATEPFNLNFSVDSGN